MTQSETRFRDILKKRLNDPAAFIKKIADMKQGTLGNKGLPDYLVISLGSTKWYEVKKSNTKTTFNFNLISESQYIEFTKMMHAGASITIAVFIGRDLFFIPYKRIHFLKFHCDLKSLDKAALALEVKDAENY